LVTVQQLGGEEEDSSEEDVSSEEVESGTSADEGKNGYGWIIGGCIAAGVALGAAGVVFFLKYKKGKTSALDSEKVTVDDAQEETVVEAEQETQAENSAEEVTETPVERAKED
ncbi:MAG: hypothetical protein IKA57_01035, partial [Clostridia bacterium]|nr:hypothetical protein [Clostridia bacterium]